MSEQIKPSSPRVAILMGSRRDWETMKHADEMLTHLHIPHERRVLSAHRAPDALLDYVEKAEERGIQVMIAGAGGAAHLAGIVSSKTILPVLGVPIQSSALHGMDSLLSMVQMPKGVPVGTLAIGQAGAANAALLAAAILGLSDPELHQRLQAFRDQQTKTVLEEQL